MQVFISWSKESSQRFAEVLRRWLPVVNQQLNPWVSRFDIAKGQHWATELWAKLEGMNEGLICVTAQNKAEPWLNFESGALTRSLGKGRVQPLLFGIEPADVTGPLGLFQSTAATDHDDMLSLLVSLNSRCAAPLDPRRLEESLDRAWDDYLAEVRVIENDPASAADARSPEDMVRETLELVRDLWRQGNDTAPPRHRGPRRRRAGGFSLDGMAFGGSVRHPAFGDGVVLKLLPDLTAADGTTMALVDFADHGPDVVRFDDLQLRDSLLF